MPFREKIEEILRGSLPMNKKCTICGKEFFWIDGRKGRSACCSDECRREHQRRSATDRYHKKLADDPTYRDRVREQGRKCRNKNREAYLERERVRAKEYRARPEVIERTKIKRWASDAKKRSIYESVNFLTIYQIANLIKGGDVCGICGERVDMTLSSLDRFGPVMDHIIPLSVGGRHDIDNLQIVHNICNVVKGGRISIKKVFENERKAEA